MKHSTVSKKKGSSGHAGSTHVPWNDRDSANPQLSTQVDRSRVQRAPIHVRRPPLSTLTELRLHGGCGWGARVQVSPAKSFSLSGPHHSVFGEHAFPFRELAAQQSHSGTKCCPAQLKQARVMRARRTPGGFARGHLGAVNPQAASDARLVISNSSLQSWSQVRGSLNVSALAHLP